MPLCRNRHHRGEIMALTEPLDQRQQLGLVGDPVDLVYREHHRHPDRLEALEDEIIILGPATGVDHHQHDIDVVQRLPRGLVEVTVHRRFRGPVQPGGVHIHELRALDVVHADDAVARGLRLAGNDADLLPEQGIEQRRLARVGSSHQGDKAAAHGLGGRAHPALPPSLSPSRRRVSMDSAACCSARRREFARPSLVTASSSTWQCTRKVWSWARPSTSTTS